MEEVCMFLEKFVLKVRQTSWVDLAINGRPNTGQDQGSKLPRYYRFFCAGQYIQDPAQILIGPVDGGIDPRIIEAHVKRAEHYTIIHTNIQREREREEGLGGPGDRA